MNAIVTFISINDKVSNHHLHQINIGDECHACPLASWTLHGVDTHMIICPNFQTNHYTQFVC